MFAACVQVGPQEWLESLGLFETFEGAVDWALEADPGTDNLIYINEAERMVPA